MSSLKHTLDDLSQYLEYMRDEGQREIEVSSEVLKSISSIPAKVITRPLISQSKLPASEKTDLTPPVKAMSTSPVDPELKKIAVSITACRKCSLHETRTKTVPGQGAVNPDIMFIGEAPGADEDLQGLAFVGRAGQLLTKMIEAMGYRREEVFIGNILKCRPPNNRQPMPDEMEMCLPYLKAQIAIIKPRVIIALGATAVKGLLNLSTGITRLRGNWLSFEGIDLMPTYHPAYLLRNPPAKKEVWEDLQTVLKHIGRTPPPRKR
ncbi:MAG: uracil-DNA glycosylase [Kiritimatiellae bacterium]|nr:uracil-DNA glycosylase [Kiritimatiellia bacterium]MDD5520047.1 uracil-DNA glycosylase [Kiritimatiellia bacterium]